MGGDSIVRWLAAIGLVAGLVLGARADHTETHDVFVLGQLSSMVYSFPACDTREQAQSIVLSYLKEGKRAAYERMMALRMQPNAKGQPSCGVVVTPVSVIEVVDAYSVREDEEVTKILVVRFTGSRGQSPLYGIFSGMTVERKRRNIRT